jgi:hypothetical protein
VAVAALSLGRAVDVLRLLQGDTRYAAEAWMAGHLAPGARVEVYQKPAFVPRVLPPLLVAHVPIADRRVEAMEDRAPTAIVLSSASRQSITHTWAADWRETRNMLQVDPAAAEFLQALETEQLSYRLAATFRRDPHLIHNRITSVNPEIRIYVRTE